MDTNNQSGPLYVKLGIRLGEQVFRDLGSRLEARTMYTARYINEKMEEFKRLESEKV